MKKIHSGHPGLLAPLNDFLLSYVFKLHEQGVIMTWIISWKASDLCCIFQAKSDVAKSLIVYSGWRNGDWCPWWVFMNLSILLQRQHQMHSISCRRYGKYWSNPCLLHLSLQVNFEDERYEDSQHLYHHTGHKKGHSCSDCVCRWYEVVSNVDF